MNSDPSPPRRRLFVQNFGCQMNEYDVERMRELLGKEGYDAVDAADQADLIVINTCSVREKAEAKVASAAGRFKELKQARPELVVAIGGCVAQQEGARLLKRVPTADFTFGPDQIPALPLGTRIVVDPWSGRLTLDRSPAVKIVSIREKVPLAVTPLMPYIKYAEQTSPALSPR